MEEELSIANLSWLTKKDNFLLQFSKKSKKLDDFIENTIQKNERSWLSDLERWEIKNKWVLKVSDICLKEYDKVFF